MKRLLRFISLPLFSIVFTLISSTLSPVEAAQALDWTSCSDSIDCATFQVPVDYNNPKGDQFTLHVVRYRAANQKTKLGSIVVNPGGPGASAIAYAQDARQIVSKSIYSKYDIIGFDERGVGASDPLRCLTDKEQDAYLAGDGSVTNKKELADMVASAKLIADRCAKAAGKKLGHYSTMESAKDMEILRSLLGENQLNFIGKSYGTYLGTLYAAMYPNRVGKFVLDGAMDPNITSKSQSLTQAISFDRSLKDYLAKYKTFSASQIKSFLIGLKTKPLVLPNGRKLTESLALGGIAWQLYDNYYWPQLNDALKQAINKGDGSDLMASVDGYNNRDANGHYENENDIAMATSCLDFPEKRGPEQMYADRKQFSTAAPFFGPYLTFAGLACHYWKASPPKQPSMKKIATKNTIIVIGVTKDPATPYEWAKTLHSILTNSTLLTYAGDGHTGHNRGNSCIDSKVDNYLLGKLAPADSVCKAA